MDAGRGRRRDCRVAALPRSLARRRRPAVRPLAGCGCRGDCLRPDLAERRQELTAAAPGEPWASAEGTSSVKTLKSASWWRPYEVVIATSVASRPRAIRMRPLRGVLWRASNVYQR